MNRKETYEVWKNRRKGVDIEAGFVDRVMQQILASEERPSSDARPAGQSPQVNGHTTWGIPSMVALLLVSLTVGLLRYGFVITLLLLMSSTGN